MNAIRTIVVAGFRPPACWVGLVGLLIVGAILSVPALATFAAAWHVPALITLVAWLAMAATQVEPHGYHQIRSGPLAKDPYIMRALERRDALEAELEHLTIASVRADVMAMLRRIDDRVLPELATRVRRHRDLIRALQQYERRQGPLVGASPENIASLRRLAQDQAQALDGLITRLSDMNANLLGLTQEADQQHLVQQAQEWEEELGAYWGATAEIFRPTETTAGERAPRR